MNTLSIFIYLIDILYNFKVLAGVFGISGFVMACAVLFVKIVNSVTDRAAPDWKMPLRYFLAPFSLIVVFSLLPSQQTMYLIAGSELSEMVIRHPASQEIYNDIRNVIQSYIRTPVGSVAP